MLGLAGYNVNVYFHIVFQNCVDAYYLLGDLLVNAQLTYVGAFSS